MLEAKVVKDDHGCKDEGKREDVFENVETNFKGGTSAGRSLRAT